MVYFPWDIDRTFWEVLALDHLNLMRNAVEWATHEEPPARVAGRGMLDVTLWRQADSITVHLVNLTNPMMMKGPVREVIPDRRAAGGRRPTGGSRGQESSATRGGPRLPVEQSGRG